MSEGNACVARKRAQHEKARYRDCGEEAAIAALVAFGLVVLLIGIRTDRDPTGALVLTTRFGALAAIVSAVFVGDLVGLRSAKCRFCRPTPHAARGQRGWC